MDKDKKDTKINIRLTSQEKENLKEYAASHDTTMTRVIESRLEDIIHPIGKN